jgi:large subunit ribosomal protein L15e
LAYSYMEESWQNPTPEMKDWLRRSAMTWRREPVVKRVARPTKLVTARRLGYKAKPGIVIVRIRIRRGGARKPRPVSGRRQKAMGSIKFTRSLGIQEIAERRAARRYPNMSIQNSYHLFSDGTSHWYEVILVDQNRGDLNHPYVHRRAKPAKTGAKPKAKPAEAESESPAEEEDS